MLSIQNVSSGYNKKKIIEDVSFDVKKGERICIVGPNGCGKSTLLKAMVGLNTYEGSILLEGKELNKIPRKEVAKKVAFMNQMTQVHFAHTVFDTVQSGRYAKMNSSPFGEIKKEDRAVVEQCMTTVDISHLADRSITHLSGGELQRVFLARCFAQEPEILLLDEPTNHLDLKYQIELMHYIKQWSQNTEGTVIAVLHDLNFALSFADKILLLSNGKQEAFESREQIFRHRLFDRVYDMDITQHMLELFGQWQTLQLV